MQREASLRRKITVPPTRPGEAAVATEREFDGLLAVGREVREWDKSEVNTVVNEGLGTVQLHSLPRSGICRRTHTVVLVGSHDQTRGRPNEKVGALRAHRRALPEGAANGPIDPALGKDAMLLPIRTVDRIDHGAHGTRHAWRCRIADHGGIADASILTRPWQRRHDGS